MRRASFGFLWAVGTVVGMAVFLHVVGVIPGDVFFKARMLLWWLLSLYCLGTSLYFAMQLLSPPSSEERDKAARQMALWRLLRQVGGR